MRLWPGISAATIQGHSYGTILVNLAERRIVQLRADRSAETSTAWLQTHPEIRVVSRDRGKRFREAATTGAPQAQQVVEGAGTPPLHLAGRRLPQGDGID